MNKEPFYLLQPVPRQELMHIWDKKKPRSGEVLDRSGTMVLVRWANDDHEWVSLMEKVKDRGARYPRYEVSEKDD